MYSYNESNSLLGLNHSNKKSALWIPTITYELNISQWNTYLVIYVLCSQGALK